jgi:hypothetical protein
MSEAPDRSKWSWLPAVGVVVLLLALYPLSIGPVYRAAYVWGSTPNPTALTSFYKPLGWFADWTGTKQVFLDYWWWWVNDYFSYTPAGFRKY